MNSYLRLERLLAAVARVARSSVAFFSTRMAACAPLLPASR
jgi:hypothetical protein